MSTGQDYLFAPFRVIEVKSRGVAVPRPRSGHRIACDDANIYCFGGYNPGIPSVDVEYPGDTWTPSRPLFSELWSFNIATCKWKLHNVVENMPEALASNAMCMNGRYLMIYGGTGAPFGRICCNDLITWRTDPGDSDAKFQIADVKGPKPPGQYGQMVLCHNGSFYTIGGTNGFDYNCDIYRLDLRTMKWEGVFVGTGGEEDPEGRYRHEVALVDNQFYILGGGTGNSAFKLTEIPVFDLETRSWTLILPKPDKVVRETAMYPLRRKCHSSVQVKTDSGVQVFVAGGANGAVLYNDIWRLDMNNLQWTLMQNAVLPKPLYFHSSAATSAGCMYIFGGIETKERDTTRNNTLYKCWLCIPKLSEMCWEALTHFNPDLDKTDPRTLLDIGVPMHFTERLVQ